MKRLFQLACAAGLLLAGCMSNPYARQVSGPGCRVVDVHDVRILQEVRGEDCAEGLSAQVTLCNPSTRPVRIRYRLTWIDVNGMEVGGGTPISGWQNFSFAPQETRRLRLDAPSADCRDFHLYLQEID